MSRLVAPIVAGLLGLAGSLGTTLFLFRAATEAIDRVLVERLQGAGGAAARILARAGASDDLLRAIMRDDELEGAYVLAPSLVIVADAMGATGSRADLLRVDQARVDRAFHGEPSVAFAYTVGDLPIATGYFPIASPGGKVQAVLALEGGTSFAHARPALRTALWTGIGLSSLVALTLAIVALMWSSGEQQRKAAATRAARGDALSRMAAMVAHEVRNPLGVIRGAAELVRERSGAVMTERDRGALVVILGEVERLRRLTQDFLDIARDPALQMSAVDLGALASEVARGLALTQATVAVDVRVPPALVRGDPTRLRQVLTNLLLNAAQAGARNVRLTGTSTPGFLRLEISDDGPGVRADLRDRLFDPFATGRVDGTGLGLALSRRIVERHGGELTLAPEHRQGATFFLQLPLAAS